MFRIPHTSYLVLCPTEAREHGLRLGVFQLPLLGCHLMSVTTFFMFVPGREGVKCILCVVAALCKLVCVQLFWK